MRKFHRLWQWPLFLFCAAVSTVLMPVTLAFGYTAVRVGHEIVAVDYDEEDVNPE